MATKTNKSWTEQELVLTLGVYFETDGDYGTQNRREIQELARLLWRLSNSGRPNNPIHSRSPSAVWYKLGNFGYLSDKKKYGIQRGADGLTMEVWQRFSKNRQELADAVRGIIEEWDPESKPSISRTAQSDNDSLLESVVNPAKKTSHNGAGFLSSADERKCVELHGMALAARYLEQSGYSATDVSRTHSCDFEAKKNGRAIVVEVKCTTGLGTEIILTKNEVRLHLERYPENMLILIHSVKLDRSGPSPSASGGVLLVQSPWLLDENKLTSLAYGYII